MRSILRCGFEKAPASEDAHSATKFLQSKCQGDAADFEPMPKFSSNKSGTPPWAELVEAHGEYTVTIRKGET